VEMFLAMYNTMETLFSTRYETYNFEKP